MAIFKKPACENLKKRNRAMTRIDSQEDDERDSMIIYKPKKVKDSSIESLYDDSSFEEKSKGNLPYWTKYVIVGIIGWIVILLLIFMFL